MLLGFVTVKVTHGCVSVPDESCGSMQRCVTMNKDKTCLDGSNDDAEII